MDTRVKIFLACALGGLIGAFLALQFHPAIWWLGCLIGGFVGYLSYEFKQVIQAIPVAWRMAVELGGTEVDVLKPWRGKKQRTLGFCFLALHITTGVSLLLVATGGVNT